MLAAFLAIIFLFVAGVAHAQKNAWPFELWYEGKVVLEQGDTLKGLIKYDLQQDLVQFAIKDRAAEVFTARKILFFEIFDADNHHYRRFFALPFQTSSGYKAPVFFELLEEGKMTLLAREYVEYKNSVSPYFFGYQRFSLDHKFFFLSEKGTVEEFTGKRNDLLEMMGQRSEDIDEYIQDNRLSLDDKYDFARIINYYNSFFGF